MIHNALTRFFLLFSICILLLEKPANAQEEELTIKLTGEYAKIEKNIKKDISKMKILSGNNTGDMQATAQEVEKNLGEHSPPTIITLACYHLSKRNLEKAALYYRFGIFRAIIDVKASNDTTLEGVVEILISSMDSAINQYLVTKADQQEFIRQICLATKQIIEMDKKTPRNYDVRWASLHSLGAFTNDPLKYPDQAGFQKIVEREHEAYIKDAKKDGLW